MSKTRFLTLISQPERRSKRGLGGRWVETDSTKRVYILCLYQQRATLACFVPKKDWYQGFLHPKPLLPRDPFPAMAERRSKRGLGGRVGRKRRDIKGILLLFCADKGLY